MRSIYGQYDKLNHAERLAMTFRAHARKDAAEVNRLCASLPRSRPSDDPTDFCNQLLGLMVATHHVVAEIQRYLGQMEGYARAGAAMHLVERHQMGRMALLQLEMANAMNQGYFETSDSTQTDESDVAENNDSAMSIEAVINPMLNCAGRHISGLITGLSSFSENLVGIDAATLLTALFPELWDEITYCRIDRLSPDASAKEAAVRMLEQTWRAMVYGEPASDHKPV